jgi:exonuclease SbcD
MSREFRLLCVGDIHLGRRPTRLSDQIADFGARVEELTPAAAWSVTVDWALQNHVDAVALAGDVVESLDDRFEAYGHLERGVRRLTEQGIAVVGVAGNHDVHALPRLADRIPDFKLVGRGGKWETVELTGASGARLAVLGWSFPEQQVRESPLDRLTVDIPADIPTVGLLHCDLDHSKSVYAPVPSRAFEAAPGVAWLLGHVHKPSILNNGRPVGYLGSLVGLDPGEPGAHGPWLARVSEDGSVSIDQQPLAPIRWESESVPIDVLSDATDDRIADELASLVDDGMHAIHRRIGATLGATRVVGCRLRLVGRSRTHRRLIAVANEIRGVSRMHGDVVYFVEKIIDDAGPALDLAQLSEANDPPGLLARRILALQRGGPEAERLVAGATAVIGEVVRLARNDLEEDDLATGEERARELLLRAGMKALEELLAQRRDVEGDRA